MIRRNHHPTLNNTGQYFSDYDTRRPCTRSSLSCLICTVDLWSAFSILALHDLQVKHTGIGHREQVCFSHLLPPLLAALLTTKMDTHWKGNLLEDRYLVAIEAIHKWNTISVKERMHTLNESTAVCQIKLSIQQDKWDHKLRKHTNMQVLLYCTYSTQYPYDLHFPYLSTKFRS